MRMILVSTRFHCSNTVKAHLNKCRFNKSFITWPLRNQMKISFLYRQIDEDESLLPSLTIEVSSARVQSALQIVNIGNLGVNIFLMSKSGDQQNFRFRDFLDSEHSDVVSGWHIFANANFLHLQIVSFAFPVS